MKDIGIGGIVLAVGLIALGLILLAICFPLPSVEWQWYLGLTGLSIILLLVSAATWHGSWIVGLIILIIAFIIAAFAFASLSEAINLQETRTALLMIDCCQGLCSSIST
jgi:hypothetical protein